MENIKKIILEIIEEEKAINMDGVDIIFDNDINELAACNYVRYNNFLGYTVDISGATAIRFNIKAIDKNIKQNFKSKKLIKKATKPYLKHVVLHEMRHVWQTRNNKKLLIDSINRRINLNGYGNIPCEADANNFARSRCNSKFERFISDMFTYCQNMHGKTFKTTKDLSQGFNYVLKLYLHSIF